MADHVAVPDPGTLGPDLDDSLADPDVREPRQAALEPVAGAERDLVVERDGLRVGVPAGTTGSALLYLRPSDGDATQVRFTRDSDGTNAVTSAATGQCFDVYGDSTDTGAEVGTWGCNGGTNQQWRLLAHPAGGFALRNVGSGLRLSSAGTSEDSAVVQQPCDLGRKVRWRVG